MSDSAPSCLIGVDGGGTSCRFALLRAGVRVEHVLGAANAASDRAGTMATLRAGLSALAAMADLGPGELAAARAHVGLAGVMTADDARQIAAGLPMGAVRVTDDRPTSVAGALGDRDGALAAIGTGSFFARRRGDDLRAIGGWGLVLGDEASGAWLGRGLLSATLHAVDGLQPHGALTGATLDRMGGPAALVDFARTATPSDFAALSQQVVAAAAEGDATGLTLMRSGADAIDRAIRSLGWAEGEALCLIGGAGPAYAPYLAPDLAGAVVPPAGTALDGALHLAARIPMAEAVR